MPPVVPRSETPLLAPRWSGLSGTFSQTPQEVGTCHAVLGTPFSFFYGYYKVLGKETVPKQTATARGKFSSRRDEKIKGTYGGLKSCGGRFV